MPKRSSKASEAKLYELAFPAQGYFTTKQAITAGYPDTVHSSHLRNGDWGRVQRGIYRLSRYPRSPFSDLVIWTLWSRDRNEAPQGVVSHATALRVHGYTNGADPRTHLTVPLGFRRMNAIPNEVVLHKAHLSEPDIELRDGFRITRLARTVTDLETSGHLAELVDAERLYRLRAIPEVQAWRATREEGSRRKSRPSQKTPVERIDEDAWAAWA